MIHSWLGQRKDMLNEYKILTVTHKSVRLERIADFVVNHSNEAELANKLTSLKEKFEFEELMYVATCNRIIFKIKSGKDFDDQFIESFFQTVNPSLNAGCIQQFVDFYQGKEALNHIYEVASSIDSLVVGEREILRQIRSAFAINNELGLTGDGIRLLMKYLIPAAKEVYAKTKIGEKPVSVVSLAFQKILSNQLPRKSRVLLVGAGQTNLLVSKFLLKYEYKNITVFNRSIENAQKLADLTGGVAKTLEELKTYKGGFDCMIVCTGATKAVITPELYQSLINGEEDQKLVVDLSVPNNVAKEVTEQFNLQYIEIEDLKQLAEQNLEFRRQEIGKARVLLKNQILDFQRAFQQRQIEKAMRKVPTEIKAVKAKALNEVFKKDIESLDDDTKALLEKMMTYMEKKCISIPMKAAKELVV